MAQLPPFYIDLLRLLHLIRQRHPKIRKHGFPGRREALALQELLFTSRDLRDIRQLDEDSYLLFLYEMAYQLDLFQEIDQQLYVHPSHAQAFFSASQETQRDLCLQAFQRLVSWHEMRFHPHLSIEPHEDLRAPFPPKVLIHARRLLLEALPLWLKEPRSLDQIEALAQETYPDLLQLRARFGEQPYKHLAIQLHNDKKRPAAAPDDWTHIEGAFIRAFFHEPLAWLGLLAPRPYPNQPFRLLEASPPLHPAHAPSLLIQPNLEILVFPSPSMLRIAYQLEHFCVPDGGDQLLQYRIEKQQFFHALRQGYPYKHLLHLLEEESKMPLPKNLRQMLESWYQQSNQIVLSKQGVVIEFPTPQALEETLQKELLEIPHYLLDERHLFVPAHAIPLLRQSSLHQQAQHLHYNQAPPRSLQIEKDLSISLDSQQADLLVESFLGRYAEPLSKGRRKIFQISKETLDRAKQRGFSLDDLHKMLDERAQIFPSAARLRLDAITQRLGEIFAGHRLLLLAPNEATLDRLLREGGLQPYAERLGARAALLQTDAKEQIAALLEPLGVTLSLYGAQEEA